jgi:uncharacterized protein YkwD
LVAVLAVVLVPPAAPRGGASLTPREATLLNRINAARAAHGLGPLAIDPHLERAARSHSVDMLRRDYFAHGDFARRLERFGVRGPVVGEDLAWHVGRLSAATTVAMWLASPPHRANLLRPGFRRVGLATPIGSFGGRRATVVTADFAGR